MSNFLLHYGVLGQKWGVRKDDKFIRVERPGYNKPTGKHRYVYAKHPNEPNLRMYNQYKKAYPDAIKILEYSAKRNLKVANRETATKAMEHVLKDKRMQQSLKDYKKTPNSLRYPFGPKLTNAFLSVGGNQPLREAYIKELSKTGHKAVTDMAMRITNGDTSAVLMFDANDFNVKEVKAIK